MDEPSGLNHDRNKPPSKASKEKTDLDFPGKLKAETIDGVIHSLTKIIEWSKLHKRRFGYFAALYRKVTIRVKEGIANGEFEDGKRMERLDVIFANRYLEAFEQHQSQKETTISWKLAFDTCKRWRPIVLQHLLLGMNSHIDLDLGIAAAEAAPREKVKDLKDDFNKINEILASQVNGVQDELAKVWPLLKLLDRLAGNVDESLANFGMKISRAKAWRVAEMLSPLSSEDRTIKIKDLDNDTFKIGKTILYQGYIIWLVLLLIRVGEMRSVPKIIQILE